MDHCDGLQLLSDAVDSQLSNYIFTPVHSNHLPLATSDRATSDDTDLQFIAHYFNPQAITTPPPKPTNDSGGILLLTEDSWLTSSQIQFYIWWFQRNYFKFILANCLITQIDYLTTVSTLKTKDGTIVTYDTAIAPRLQDVNIICPQFVNGNHWILVIVEKKQHNINIEIYDSHNVGSSLDWLNPIIIWFRNQFPEHIISQNTMNCIQQNNDFDCGIHMLANLIQNSTGSSTSFDNDLTKQYRQSVNQVLQRPDETTFHFLDANPAVNRSKALSKIGKSFNTSFLHFMMSINTNSSFISDLDKVDSSINRSKALSKIGKSFNTSFLHFMMSINTNSSFISDLDKVDPSTLAAVDNDNTMLQYKDAALKDDSARAIAVLFLQDGLSPNVNILIFTSFQLI